MGAGTYSRRSSINERRESERASERKNVRQKQNPARRRVPPVAYTERSRGCNMTDSNIHPACASLPGERTWARKHCRKRPASPSTHGRVPVMCLSPLSHLCDPVAPDRSKPRVVAAKKIATWTESLSSVASIFGGSRSLSLCVSLSVWRYWRLHCCEKGTIYYSCWRVIGNCDAFCGPLLLLQTTVCCCEQFLRFVLGTFLPANH